MIKRLIYIFALLQPGIGFAGCPLLLNALGHSIFDPVYEDRAWLSQDTDGTRRLFRVAKVNTTEGWYEVLKIDLRNPSLTHLEGLVDVLRLSIRKRYDDNSIVDGKGVYPEFYVQPTETGIGNYKIKYIPSQAPKSIAYSWQDLGKERHVLEEHDGYFIKATHKRNLGLTRVELHAHNQPVEVSDYIYGSEKEHIKTLAESHLPQGVESDPFVPKGFSFIERKALNAMNVDTLTRQQSMALWYHWKRQLSEHSRPLKAPELDDHFSSKQIAELKKVGLLAR